MVVWTTEEDHVGGVDNLSLGELAQEGARRARESGEGYARIGSADFKDFPARGPKTFEDVFEDIGDELFSLMVRKQRDYGSGNISKFGSFGVLVRMSDKFERLLNLLDSGREPENESVEDTVKDIANYAMIMLALNRGQWGLPLQEEIEEEEPEKLREF